MFVNLWLGMRKTASEVVKTRLNWDDSTEYTGPITDREYKLFKLMADQEVVEGRFKVAIIGGNQWVLWTIGFEKPLNVLQKVQDEIDALLLKYPTQVYVGGAWFWDGRQVGTQFDAEGNLTGTPTYPIPAQLLKFMPDVWNGDDPPTYSTATVLADEHLSLGQSPRDFA